MYKRINNLFVGMLLSKTKQFRSKIFEELGISKLLYILLMISEGILFIPYRRLFLSKQFSIDVLT